jgi:hypothetical protein
LAAFSASSMIAPITLRISAWANSTAPSISSGQFLGFRFHHHHGIVGGGDDEVELALGNLRQRRVELYSPSLKPTRAAPIGPMNGTPEMVSAAEAAIIATISGSVSPS